ncbi:MAG: glucose-1-phosphate thymidylyltransferase RfbA [Planctomycetota bacterium]
MKGILLAGGHGTRLAPLTNAVSKQLLPVYNKPMVYYPLSVLMLAGLRDVMIVTTPIHRAAFEATLGDGTRWGMSLTYAEQDEPRGIAEALLLNPEFHAGHPTCLVLGDNLIYGAGLRTILTNARKRASEGGAVIFAHAVRNPSQYGVIELDTDGNAVSIEEKPEQPRSQLAVPGLYFHDARAAQFAGELKPSARGELEITELNRRYLADSSLHVERWSRGTAWFDAGTHESLLEAQNFVQSFEHRQGSMIACPEEIAYRQGWINRASLKQLGEAIANPYGRYLLELADDPQAVPPEASA